MGEALHLHLVRHAHTDALGHLLAGRAPGHGLNREGHDAAGCLAERLGSCPASVLYSSPQQRARQTAEPISHKLGLGVHVEADLDEIDFGQWTGRSFAELALRQDWQDWNRIRSLACCPGGESMLDVQARIIRFTQRLMVSAQDHVVLVSHGDVIKALLAYALGMPLDMMHRIEIAPASHSIVVLSSGEVKVECLNALAVPSR